MLLARPDVLDVDVTAQGFESQQNASQDAGLAVADAFLYGDADVGRVIGPAAQGIDLLLSRQCMIT